MAAGMSPSALKRCRKMTIKDISQGAEFRRLITVYDPTGKVMSSLTARTPQDLSRIKNSWISRYRIPLENVSDKEEAKNDEGKDKAE